MTVPAAAVAGAGAPLAGRENRPPSLTGTALRRCLGRWTPHLLHVRIGYVVLTIFGLVALLAPLLAAFDPIAQLDVALKNAHPSPAHPLGTDSFSRDVLSRLMHGARSSLTVASIATTIAIVVGVLWGLLSASVGGVARDVMLSVVDMMRSVPRMLLLLLAFAVFGALDAVPLGVALGVMSWPTLAMLVDARARSVRVLPYCEAAVALGVPSRGILLRTVLPQIAGAIGAAGALLLADLLAVEAGLSFVGLGIRPPQPSWGGMIQDALPYLRSAPLGVAIPVACVVMVVLGATCVADGTLRHDGGTGAAS